MVNPSCRVSIVRRHQSLLPEGPVAMFVSIEFSYKRYFKFCWEHRPNRKLPKLLVNVLLNPGMSQNKDAEFYLSK